MTYTDPTGFCPEPTGTVCFSIVATIANFLSGLFGGSDEPPPDWCADGGPNGCWGEPTTQVNKFVSDTVSLPNGPSLQETGVPPYLDKLLSDQAFLRTLRLARNKTTQIIRAASKDTPSPFDAPVERVMQEMGSIIFKDEAWWRSTKYEHSFPHRVVASGAQTVGDLTRDGGIGEFYGATYKITNEDAVAIYAHFPNNVYFDIESIRETILINEFRRPFFLGRSRRIFVIHGKSGPYDVTDRIIEY